MIQRTTGIMRLCYLPLSPAVTTNCLHKLAVTVAIILLCSCNEHEDMHRSWGVYGGSKENIHYSSLSTIDTSSVSGLTVAWTYNTGDKDTAHHSQIQCNPIVVNGLLYGISPQLKVFALNAATGQEKWVFSAIDSLSNAARKDFVLNNSRGLTYWTDSLKDERVFFTAGSFTYCLNAQTGKVVKDFGNNGRIDLHDGLDAAAADLYITATSPGIIYKHLLVLGSRVDEGAAAAPGHIRAFNVRTGKQEWIFHTIPQPGEQGYETWDDKEAYKNIGGANAWSGFSLDEKRGIVFAATGSASSDFYGGKRKGQNLFANCILALDAANGKRIWHFQTVHHDVWDKDLPAAPSLVRIHKNGKWLDAVAQTTKTGYVFVLDRSTGKSFYPIEERTVPSTSFLEGEQLSPTQPVPLLPAPFVRQRFEIQDINPLVPDSSYKDVKERWLTYKKGSQFTPPSREGTIIFPGFDGGAEWGGPAFDPQTGVLFVNANEMPWVLTMVDLQKKEPKQENHLQAGLRLYRSNCMNCHGKEKEGSGKYPSLTGVNKRYSEQQLLELITTGRRMMPGFAQLKVEEKKAIASYVLETNASAQTPFTLNQERNSYRNLPFGTTGYNKFLTKEGYPAVAPPWGTLNAIDLGTGKFVWKIPLGDHPDFLKDGISTGTENYGGPVVTAGGLVFIAATKDGKFRAFNKRNGKMLWETALPAPGFATPATYEINGKQYIVIACGGGKLGTTSGDAYTAFALPAEVK
ncbi:MAG: PQQ-binding-like beta-propeller repeat protein [Chitinophagaceae bacterium]